MNQSYNINKKALRVVGATLKATNLMQIAQGIATFNMCLLHEESKGHSNERIIKR